MLIAARAQARAEELVMASRKRGFAGPNVGGIVGPRRRSEPNARVATTQSLRLRY